MTLPRGLSLLAIALALLGLSCSSREGQPLSDDGGVKRRVFNPPPSRVRAMPPHNIHAEGIGPYQLGAPLKQILSTLPHGPRIELFRLGNLADFSLVRSEAGALLVGVQRGEGVTFVASVGAKIARTEADVGVGSDLKLATKELGGELTSTTMIRDPRFHRFGSLPGVLFVSDGTRGAKKEQVGAVIVDGVAAGPAKVSGNEGEGADDAPARRCPIEEKLAARVRELARLGDTARVAYACSDGQPVIAVASRRDRLVWLLIDRDKVRRGTSLTLSGLRFAAPLSLEPDRVVIVAVSEIRSADELRISADLIRIEGQRVAGAVTRRIYTVSRDAVTWVGGALAGIEVPVEVTAVGSSELRVRGFYIERERGRVVMVAPLAQRTLKLNVGKRKPSSTLDAGPVDGGGSAAKPDASRARSPVGPR